jgi:hypothetical protein
MQYILKLFTFIQHISSTYEHCNTILKNIHKTQFAIIGNRLGTLLIWPIGGITRHMHTFLLQTGTPLTPIRQLQQFEHTISS